MRSTKFATGMIAGAAAITALSGCMTMTEDDALDFGTRLGADLTGAA